jgi:DNA-binding transcriptional LysR family regulator
MLDLNKLQHFRALARSGSFNRASTELNLTQPSLTRSIQSLERQYGIRLLERERGRAGIQLTQAGHELLRYADELLNLGDELERTLVGARSDGPQTLAFGLGPMLAGAMLEGLLEDLYEKHPNLDATVIVGSTGVMYPKLLAGEIEFYIGQSFGQKQSSRVRRTHFASTPPSFFVRPEHPLTRHPNPSLQDLAEYPRMSGTAWNDTLSGLPAEAAAALRCNLQIDNFNLLTKIAEATDSILITSYREPSARLTDLPIEFIPDAEHTQVSLFSLKGIRLSRLANEAIARLCEGATGTAVPNT